MDATEQAKRWLEAAKVLAQDPEAHVACPNCTGRLETHDVRWSKDPSQLERYIACPYCGARDVMRLRRNPSEPD